MSATAFLRHRRAVAVAYINKALKSSDKDRVAEILVEHKLLPTDLESLAGNTDVLTIADRLAAEKLGQEDLDDLEELNVLSVGERAAVHSPDVRDDQFEDRLQHPCQETVGVGNMHDGSEAAEDLANVSGLRVDANDGSIAKAAAEKASEDPLATHGQLPVVTPTSAPAADNQVVAEDAGHPAQPTDPDGVAPAAATVVDLDQAAADLKKLEAQSDKLEKLGEEALGTLDREQLFDYAEKRRITLDGVSNRSAPKTIVRAILEAQGA